MHQAAQDEDRDFADLGPHSFRPANIAWRQEIGDSGIEASKITSHANLEMTGEYTRGAGAPERVVPAAFRRSLRRQANTLKRRSASRLRHDLPLLSSLSDVERATAVVH